MASQTQTQLAKPSVPAVVEGISLTRQHGSSGEHDTAREDEEQPSAPVTSMVKTVAITLQLAGVNFTTSAANGLVVVGLPAMSTALHLPSSLAFWPASVSSLATASTLLLVGAIADALGPRWVELLGSVLCGAAMVASGGVRTGEELVAMRALNGLGMAMHLAASVSITTKVLERGRGRNVAFACLGLSQPLGFSFGLVLCGVFVDSIGWRAGWWIYGGINLFLCVFGLWAIPADSNMGPARKRVREMKSGVDWAGAFLASAFMATLCYLLAIVSSDIDHISRPDAIVCLCISVASLGGFITWMHYQTKMKRPALIPNFMWKNVAFSCTCAAVSLSYAVLNSMELFSSLFYQEVQHLSALQASIRILPSLVVGVILNLGVGLFVHKIPVIWLIVGSSVICAVSPLLMAVVEPEWTYWANAFIAQLLQPVSGDILFTVGLIIITDVFPEDTQGLAGAVFNTMGQFGQAVGLAILQVVSQVVTSQHDDLEESLALLQGYRASFWTMFGFMIVCAALGIFGFRRIGKIGLKQD